MRWMGNRDISRGGAGGINIPLGYEPANRRSLLDVAVSGNQKHRLMQRLVQNPREGGGDRGAVQAPGTVRLVAWKGVQPASGESPGEALEGAHSNADGGLLDPLGCGHHTCNMISWNMTCRVWHLHVKCAVTHRHLEQQCGTKHHRNLPLGAAPMHKGSPAELRPT